MSETHAIEAAIGDQAVAALATGMRGACFTPSDVGSDDARIVWNGSIDKYPSTIPRCFGVADVTVAVNFSRANYLLVAVPGRRRGTGLGCGGRGDGVDTMAVLTPLVAGDAVDRFVVDRVVDVEGREVGPRDHGLDPGHGLGRAGVDRHDPGVSVR